ncbi:MAG: Fe-S-containing hydro-lyase [bacterium]
MIKKQTINLTAPLTEESVKKLKVGDRVLLGGVIYTARDAAHKRLDELIKSNKELPIDLGGQIIYYVGPTPAKPGSIIGSAGPTTSYRMDPYTPDLLDKGLKGIIGKGARSKEVVKALKKHKAVYLVAVGGAGALISRCIKKVKLMAFEDLGPEAIYRLEVENFPLIVAVDAGGADLFNY